ncbi:hypothetical protein NIES2100_70830 [Calothrix sp. NIES-2100]|uniref:hypothetical protein n=1 Tax=Calothrix sp. NIES-2100 TaxID=1954172 RepID=UPI000B61F934|nr:hypothetical protein NIES2100_70830 [Calothrix sp. NIES-2100]
MNTFNITFDIPDWIQEGLNNSQYQRFGGVIRETNSGNIVAHLRETSFCIDKALLSITELGSLASILNLGVSVVGFTLILNKLNDINNRLLSIESNLQRIELKIDNINSKIDLSFKSELIGALNQLNKAMLIDEIPLRKQLIVNIVSIFEKSKELFKNLLLKALEEVFYNYEGLLSLYQLYILSYFSYIGLTISYLELEELHISNTVLKESYAILKEIYEEILLVSDDNYDVEKLEEEFISMVEYLGVEKFTIPPSSLIEYLFIGEKLHPDHEAIKIRNEKKIEYAKQVIKEMRIICFSLDNFIEEINFIQKLQLTWVEWKTIKPVDITDKSEYMYIINTTSTFPT